MSLVSTAVVRWSGDVKLKPIHYTSTILRFYLTQMHLLGWKLFNNSSWKELKKGNNNRNVVL